MSPWIEIYDSEEVHGRLRQQVAMHSTTIAVAISVAVFLGSLAGLYELGQEVMLLSLVLVALSAAAVTGARLLGLQSHVWCIKMSPHMIMGYNHSQKATAFPWSDVDHVAIDDRSLTIVASGRSVIEIPTSFADFVHVSHRVMDLAELHRRPIHLMGKSLPDVNLISLMPELTALLASPLVPGAEPAR
jgi:hypothetical protein